MKKYLYFLIVFLLLGLTAVHAQKVRRVKALGFGSKISGVPLELVKIPAGRLERTGREYNVSGLNESWRQPVLISEFYISTREVTNVQYKEFTEWVCDSIAAYLLGGKYLDVNRRTGETTINWKLAAKIDFSDPKNQDKLAPMMLDGSRTLSHRPEIDPDKLVYLVQGIDYREAAKPENRGRNPNDFVYKYPVKIYPDTLVWLRDYGYSNNEQMALGYFSSNKYKNYPVVGVNWIQANAYCDWFTKQKINREQTQKKLAVGGVCRLPTEMEWAYAANLNNDDAPQTFVKKENTKSRQQSQTLYTQQSDDDNLAELNKINNDIDQKHKSFWSLFRRRPKVQQQVVANSNVQQNTVNNEDQNPYYAYHKKTRIAQEVAIVNDKAEADPDAFLPFNTMNIKPGRYGLSGMANNVSEWTGTSYYDGGSNFESRFNPDIKWGSINSDSKSQRRKVVRGGSWKDIARYKTINNRFYNDMFDDRSYIGFRVVVINLPE